MKKIMAVLTCVVLGLGLVGCGNAKDKGINSNLDKPKSAQEKGK
jgi:hypothetical protein